MTRVKVDGRILVKKQIKTRAEYQLVPEVYFLKLMRGCAYVVQMVDNPSANVILLENFGDVDLFDYISERTKLTVDESKIFTRQIVAGLRECMQRGIWHGDVKDENIIVDSKSKRVKLVDFGSASLISKPTKFCGTNMYATREILKGIETFPSEESTVWSVGILVYDMVEGDIPFQTVQEITSCKSPYYKKITDEQCLDFIKKCLDYDPKARPSLNSIATHDFLCV